MFLVKENIEEKAVEKIEEVEIKTDVAPKEKIPGTGAGFVNLRLPFCIFIHSFSCKILKIN